MKRGSILLAILLLLLLLLTGCAAKRPGTLTANGQTLSYMGKQEDGSYRYKTGDDVYTWKKGKGVAFNGKDFGTFSGNSAVFSFEDGRVMEAGLGKDGLPETVTVAVGTEISAADYKLIQAAGMLYRSERGIAKKRTNALLTAGLILLGLAVIGIFGVPLLLARLAKDGRMDADIQDRAVKPALISGILMALVGILLIVLIFL